MSFDRIAHNPYRAGFRAGLAAALLVAATAAGVAYLARATGAPPVAAADAISPAQPLAGARVPAHTGFVGLPGRSIDRFDEPE